MKWMRCLLFLTPLAVVSPVVIAATDRGLAQQQLTVRELMRIEADLALERARGQQHARASDRNGSSAQTNRVATSDALRLVGIYGVGQRLFAEVRSEGKALVFLNGHRLPVGRDARSTRYRLKSLTGRCVRLEDDMQETLLCLENGVGR